MCLGPPCTKANRKVCKVRPSASHYPRARNFGAGRGFASPFWLLAAAPQWIAPLQQFDPGRNAPSDPRSCSRAAIRRNLATRGAFTARLPPLAAPPHPPPLPQVTAKHAERHNCATRVRLCRGARGQRTACCCARGAFARWRWCAAEAFAACCVRSRHRACVRVLQCRREISCLHGTLAIASLAVCRHSLPTS